MLVLEPRSTQTVCPSKAAVHALSLDLTFPIHPALGDTELTIMDFSTPSSPSDFFLSPTNNSILPTTLTLLLSPSSSPRCAHCQILPQRLCNTHKSASSLFPLSSRVCHYPRSFSDLPSSVRSGNSSRRHSSVRFPLL